jgi:adenosylcobinamide kinase/adenosylcobinamide-phosphate guanylyltransferase
VKILYFGGQKCGKSLLAEQKTLELCVNTKPYYIATYDNSYGDLEMQKRIDKHLLQRQNSFYTIEETKDLLSVIEDNKTYLVDCVSMWLLNCMYEPIEKLLEHIQSLAMKNANIVFVLNDVTNGVIPCEKESRKYVDYTGMIGQEIVKLCDEVYEVKFGLPVKIK